jgi:Tol biopolymer transport system component
MRSVSGRTAFAGFLAVVLVALCAGVAVAGQGPKVKPASVRSNGDFPDGESSTEGTEQLSGDGHLYVFQSNSTNLVPHTGTLINAYLHNFKTGKTKLLSTDSHGKPATGFTDYPEISANGRIAVFHGLGTGLPGANGTNQVWAKNLKTGRTQLVSKSPSGQPGEGGNSALPFVSATGRYVVFGSSATNFPGAGKLHGGVYIRDLKKHKTFLASRSSSGEAVDGNPYGQTLSGNGDLVVFSSSEMALPGADGTTHLYLRNLKTGKTRLIDRAANGDPANAPSQTPSISQNGRYIVYDSSATNLPGPGVDGGGYRYDIKTKKTNLVTRASDGSAAVGGDVRISADGKLVAFDAKDAALPGGGMAYQVYARNLKTGKTTLLSHDRNGDPGDSDSYYPSLSEDGRFACFESHATNLGGNPPGTKDLGYRAGPISR